MCSTCVLAVFLSVFCLRFGWIGTPPNEEGRVFIRQIGLDKPWKEPMMQWSLVVTCSTAYILLRTMYSCYC